MENKKKLYIGIVGSRRRDTEGDFITLVECLRRVTEPYEDEYDIIIVSGGCKQGGDRFAEIIAKECNVPIIIHYPDKSKLPKNPTKKDFRNINYDRNTLIARDSDILIALTVKGSRGGTDDTVDKYIGMGKDEPYLI